ncbi:hypothetical protein EDB92DRAFT_1871820 [Lactarius akahatsu]|uniref:Uncharacterized protein n=1 Tax=Lactarius akahatsu TaxID=416441 RepID=A0AAD4QC03_9AGAM|nr:hypothetical protein EDB92DRAFT_1871820 [Lactarius akahatsu]
MGLHYTLLALTSYRFGAVCVARRSVDPDLLGLYEPVALDIEQKFLLCTLMTFSVASACPGGTILSPVPRVKTFYAGTALCPLQTVDTLSSTHQLRVGRKYPRDKATLNPAHHLRISCGMVPSFRRLVQMARGPQNSPFSLHFSVHDERLSSIRGLPVGHHLCSIVRRGVRLSRPYSTCHHPAVSTNLSLLAWPVQLVVGRSPSPRGRALML